MAIQSINNLLSSIAAGKTREIRWQKQLGGSNYSTGRSYDLSTLTGHPVATAYAGTSLVAQTCHELVGDGTNTFGAYLGGDQSSDIKHLMNVSAMSTSTTGVPSTIILCDFLMYYPGINMNSNALQTLINSNTFTASSSSGLLLTYTNDFRTYTQVRFTTTGTLPTGLSLATDYWIVRQSGTTANVSTSMANAIAGTFIAYTDAGTGTHTMTVQIPRYTDGSGVRAFLKVKTTTGGSAHNLAYSYTNQAGTASRTNPVTVGCNVNNITPAIAHSGTGTNNYEYLPMQSGDIGIQSFQSVQLSAASGGGTADLILVKELATIPLSLVYVTTKIDLLNSIPSFPVIKNGACVSFLLQAGANVAASSNFSGSIEAVWG